MRTEEWSLFSFDPYMSDPYRWLKQRRKSWRSRRKHYLQGNWQLTGVKSILAIQSCQSNFPCLQVWPSSLAWPGWKGGKSCCCYTGAFWHCNVWTQTQIILMRINSWEPFLAAQDQLPKEEKPEFQRKGRRWLKKWGGTLLRCQVQLLRNWQPVSRKVEPSAFLCSNWS